MKYTSTTLTAASLLLAASASANTTDIQPPSGEPTHAEILGDIYGSAFTTDGLSLTNGNVTATRIDDDQDQQWAAGRYNFEALGSYADYSQSFGIIQDGTLTPVFEVEQGDGTSEQIQGQGTIEVSSGFFELVRFGDRGQTASTAPGSNLDGKDYAVTYRIDPVAQNGDGDGEANAEATYLVFFEDIAVNNGSDMDFNDLVVRIGPDADLPPIPEPSALVLAAMGGLMLVSRRRRA